MVLHSWLTSGRPTTAAALADHLETTTRTIKRDIERLRDFYDAPIIWDARNRSYRYTRDDYQLPLLRLNVEEAMALALASETFSAWRGSMLGQALASAFAKIGDTIGNALSLSANDLAHCVSRPAQGSDHAAEQTHFPIVLKAILQHRGLGFEYCPPHGNRGSRHVHPLHLTTQEQRWILIAWDPSRKVARRYNLARMRNPTMRSATERFNPPTEFDLTAYLASTFGPHAGHDLHHVRLRFTAYAAPFIREHLFHPSQRIAEIKDGAGDIEVQVTVNHLLDVQRWVLSWGRHAEVLAPVEFRRQIVAELDQLQTTYAPERPPPSRP